MNKGKEYCWYLIIFDDIEEFDSNLITYTMWIVWERDLTKGRSQFAYGILSIYLDLCVFAYILINKKKNGAISWAVEKLMAIYQNPIFEIFRTIDLLYIVIFITSFDQ